VTVDVPETLSPILTDAALLERAIANLISNALAFAPDRVVHVVAGLEAPELPIAPTGDPAPAPMPERIELRIIDRGPGIPIDQRRAVFRPFQRLGDGGNAHADGVGLGLAVARGFVEATDGHLTLDDTPGGGLTASISLPVAPVSIAPMALPDAPGAPVASASASADEKTSVTTSRGSR
jgi:two-component system sensor histidine kinase KdpD